jgi:protein disulfide-isomerase
MEWWMRYNFYHAMKIFFALFFVCGSLAAAAADKPYNETADAKSDVQQSLAQATLANTPVIVVFGANWCGDCKMLDHALKSGTSAALLARDFKVVKINVGRFDKNLDIVKAYGVPLEKGIPAVVILSTNNAVLYVTKEGELADAQKMGDQGIYEFFKRVTAPYRNKQ